jgi:hypothetical protein
MITSVTFRAIERGSSDLAAYEVLVDGQAVGSVRKVRDSHDVNRHSGGPRGHARMVASDRWTLQAGTYWSPSRARWATRGAAVVHYLETVHGLDRDDARKVVAAARPAR